jgi:putative heme-binding domain-containing protein
MLKRGIAALFAVCFPALPQHGSSGVVNPYTGPDDARSGARLFRAQCAGCHGPEGGGTAAGPSLTTGTYKRGGSDEALFVTVSKGVPGTAMPAFAAFTGLEVWQLVTHLRTLSITHGAVQVKGDAQAGAEVFRSVCSTCHAVGDTGGFTGPDLTMIGARRSAGELRRALSEPDADVASRYWTVGIRTKSGQTVRGVRLNEDTHSYQLRDESGRLISILKRDIADAELVRRSAMTAIAGKLSDAQIENLVAYLVTLRRER